MSRDFSTPPPTPKGEKLFECIWCGKDVETVEKLISEGANPEARMSNGDTPMHMAAKKGRADIAEVLVKHGASVNPISNDGWSALHEAAKTKISSDHFLSADSTKIAEFMILHGADVNIKTPSGFTPLHEAARYGNIPLIELLIAYGANPNLKTYEYGRTAEDIVSVSPGIWDEDRKIILNLLRNPNL